jgi:hypothetical protein
MKLDLCRQLHEYLQYLLKSSLNSLMCQSVAVAFTKFVVYYLKSSVIPAIIYAETEARFENDTLANN